MQILKKFQNYHFVDVNKLPQPAETSAFFIPFSKASSNSQFYHRQHVSTHQSFAILMYCLQLSIDLSPTNQKVPLM